MNKPKRWYMLSKEEQAALKMAHRIGLPIEVWNAANYQRWFFITRPSWQPHCAYRIQPLPSESSSTP